MLLGGIAYWAVTYEVLSYGHGQLWRVRAVRLGLLLRHLAPQKIP